MKLGVMPQNITARQARICRTLLDAQSLDEVERYVDATCKTKEEVREVLTLMNLMVAEYYDQRDLGDCADARRELDRIMRL